MEMKDIKRGFGSDERPVAAVLWARDAYNPAAPELTVDGRAVPTNRNVDYSRYHDPAWAKAEEKTLWRKTWLYAAREEDIPEVGDRIPLHVGSQSYIIARSGENEFKAFYNSCPHRGTMLCDKKESGETIRCPYHAWEWGVDGRLKRIPSHWDFPEITRNNGGLPEVKIDRWGGFLFINADPDCAPLAEALGVIPEHFAPFEYDQRYTAARFRKQVRANWKIAQEAFMEAYHLFGTHPEASPFNGDAQTQYDIWDNGSGHVGRNAGCSVLPSMFAPAEATMHSAAQMFVQSMRDWHYPNADVPTIDPDGDPRAQAAEWHREMIRQKYGREMKSSNAVMMDSLLYFMFPHACFWLSESVPFTYQFTPHETDCEQSYFEVRMMLPCPVGQPRPPSSPAIQIGPDEKVFDKAPAFGFLGFVFDQDMSNMPLIQRGTHAADPAFPKTRLGVYQEQIIQHWNAVVEDMVSKA